MTRFPAHVNRRGHRPATNLSVQVHQATGMVSGQLRVPVADAFARLRVYAALTDQSLFAVAVSVVERRVTLSSPASIGPEGNAVWWGFGTDLWAPRRSRQYIRTLLSGWGVADEPQQDAQYVASELVTNAVDHAGGVMGVAVRRSDNEFIKVAVADGCADVPNLQTPNRFSSRGRGLQTVDAITLSWGYNVHEFGKTVWAKIDAQH